MQTSKFLIFTDLDGTLLDHHSYSFKPAIPMLNKLSQLKIDVIPTTSKTFEEVTIIRNEAKLLTPFIVENGAAIYIPIDFFPQQPDETEIHNGFWRKAFSKPRQHWLDLIQSNANHHGDYFQCFSAMTTEQLSLYTGLSPEQAIKANQREFSEPLKWLGNQEQQQSFCLKMKAVGAKVIQGGRFLHVSDKCNKGSAMLWLSKEYSKATNNHYKNIALGDSYNDNDMLEMADIAVQIKSPKHPFPQLFRTDNIIQSRLTGPQGWSECIGDIVNVHKEQSHG